MTTNYFHNVRPMNYWQGRRCRKEGGRRVVENDGGESLKPALTHEAAKMMFDASCNLIVLARSNLGKPYGQNLARKWFGKTVDLEQVEAKLDTLGQYLRTKRLQVRFARDKAGSLGAYDADFHVPEVAQLGKPILYTRYSWGEKVMTFIHEVSHVVLGTMDRGVDSDHTNYRLPLGACYGPDALALAQGKLASKGLQVAHALTNAENWGYFIVSHHALVETTRYDWLGYDEYTYLDDESLSSMPKYLAGRPALPYTGLNSGDHFESDLFDLRITDDPRANPPPTNVNIPVPRGGDFRAFRAAMYPDDDD